MTGKLDAVEAILTRDVLGAPCWCDVSSGENIVRGVPIDERTTRVALTCRLCEKQWTRIDVRGAA